jgi:hypothetical protein
MFAEAQKVVEEDSLRAGSTSEDGVQRHGKRAKRRGRAGGGLVKLAHDNTGQAVMMLEMKSRKFSNWESSKLFA